MNLSINFYKLGLDHHDINAWFRGMYLSFFDSLEMLGCKVIYDELKPNNNADVLVVPLGGGQDRSSAQAMKSFKGPVIINIGSADYWFRKGFLERWKNQILFAYGTDGSENSKAKFLDLGIRYYNIPFGSNSDIMKPLDINKLYDVIFVGNAQSGKGRDKYIKLLMKEIKNNYKIMFIGPGWEQYGFPSQSIAWGDVLNIFYNLSHICINLLNDEQKNIGKRLDSNNRLFDLAMAGAFQISNAPQVIKSYFNEKEVIAIDKPEEWVSKIIYYLNHKEEMESFRLAARKRALIEHTWENRANLFVKAIENEFINWRKRNSSRLIINNILKIRDIYLPPYNINYGINKIKKRF